MLKDVARILISVYSTMPTKSLVLFANFGIVIVVQMVNVVSIESDKLLIIKELNFYNLIPPK